VYAGEDNEDEDEANKPSDLEVQCLDIFLRRRPYVRYPPVTLLYYCLLFIVYYIKYYC
jgi:hypothetical protein